MAQQQPYRLRLSIASASKEKRRVTVLHNSIDINESIHLDIEKKRKYCRFKDLKVVMIVKVNQGIK